jgi:vacuolar-type H+-ATPase subunit I/STV1
VALATLDSSEGTLSSSAQAADGALSGLADRAAAVQEAVGAVLARVHERLAELGTRQDALEEDLEGRMSEAGSEQQALGERVQELADVTSEGLARAEASLETFNEALEAARASWHERYDAFAAQVDALEQVAHEQAEAYGDAVEALLARQTPALVDELTNERLVAAHNAALEAVDELLGEDEGQAEERFGALAAPLLETLAAVGEVCAGQEGTLRERAAAALARVQAAIALCEDTRPPLDSADALA